MNVHTPARYDERILHLALGVEPRDAASGLRLGDTVDVRLESFPRPVDAWRRWPPGATLTAALPRLDRHPGGRFSRRYDQPVPLPTTVRIVDDRRRGGGRDPGEGRSIVPRRVRLDLADEQTVLDAEADPDVPPHPAWRRVFPLACFPGATAALPPGATVLRGRIRRDVGGGQLRPVRWARVRARDADDVDVGWAHGDDRGEFVLVVAPLDDGVVVPASPLAVTLTVGADIPAPLPDPADPRLAEVDPLWDLPVEDVVSSPTPHVEPTISGRRFLPTHTVGAPLQPPAPLALPIGRETAAEIIVA